jgi:glutamyl-tRNA synthetase
MKTVSIETLLPLVTEQLERRGWRVDATTPLGAMCALFRDRCATMAELAEWLGMYFAGVAPSEELQAVHVTEPVRPALRTLREHFTTVEWSKAPIAAAIKAALAAHGLKMPQLAQALRVLVCGRVQTPSIDAVLELFDRNVVLARLHSV